MSANDQIENVSFEFADPKIERMVSLTPADRRWMDDIVHTVEETYDSVSFRAHVECRPS